MVYSAYMHIKVRVRANARKKEFEALSAASFKISVREKAEGNAANRRVVELIARHFKVPIKMVRIVKGHHAPSKILTVLPSRNLHSH